MFSVNDKNEILAMIKQAKDEIRKEIWNCADNALGNHANNRNTFGIAFVALSEDGKIDEVTASEHTALFSEWNAGIAYTTGNIRQYEECLYKCLQSHTAQEDWTPDKAVSLWKKIGDPSEEFPEWSQPVGAGDAYMKGDKVSYTGKHWVSDVDNNVWMPGVYGWSEV